MILAAEIINFRTHEKTSVRFHEGVNAFLGLPDSGKTNILRSIKWAAENRPLGFRFHSDFAKGPTSVRLTTLDDPEGDYGWGIKLTKDGKGAEYWLSDGREEQTLKALGSDVPDKVREVLNLNDINVQQQLDQPYLICSSAAEVARVFNRATRLEKVDDAASSMTTKINSANKMLRTKEVEIDTARQTLEKLPSLDALEPAVVELERLDKQVDDAIDDHQQLSYLIQSLEAKLQMRGQFGDLDAYEEAIEKAASVQTELLSVSDDYAELESFIRILQSRSQSLYEKREEIEEEKQQMIKLLHSMKTCPYCKFCKTPMQAHSIDELLEEF